jgi:hypothetical protein
VFGFCKFDASRYTIAFGNIINHGTDRMKENFYILLSVPQEPAG